METAVNNPTVPTKPSKIDDVAAPLIQEYHKLSYSLDDLSKIGLISTLPPSDGCRIATSFSNALAALDERQASYVFKNLMLLGSSQD
jgi:hypothetical protein